MNTVRGTEEYCLDLSILDLLDDDEIYKLKLYLDLKEK